MYRLVRNWLVRNWRELMLLCWVVTLAWVYLLSLGLGAGVSLVSIIGWIVFATAVSFVAVVASLMALRIVLWIKEVRTMP